MTLTPLLSAPLWVQIHAVSALAALAIGMIIFTRVKGDRTHRIVGRAWVALLAVTALSTIFMPSLFTERAPYATLYGYGPIHILSVITILGLINGVWAAMNGRIATHQRQMRVLFVFALLGAGAFTLLPGRIMNAVVFGGG